MNQITGNKTEADDAGLRRDRLALLKARRQSLVEPVVEHSFSKAQAATKGWASSDAEAAVAAPAAPVKSNLLVDLMAGKLQGGKAARAQIMAKAMQLLTKTPLDADGLIPGTPFSSAGLSLLVQMLRGKAEAGGTGSKAMQTVLNFLQATPGETATPQGLSLSKIQMIAQRIPGGAGQSAPMAAPAAFKAVAGGASATQRQIMGKLHYMLTNTPPDGRGMVAGTGFSAAGVTRLMTLLRQRATQPGTQGGRMAVRLLDALAASPGEAEVIDGASVPKLRSLAARLAGSG